VISWKQKNLEHWDFTIKPINKEMDTINFLGFHVQCASVLIDLLSESQSKSRSDFRIQFFHNLPINSTENPIQDLGSHRFIGTENCTQDDLSFPTFAGIMSGKATEAIVQDLLHVPHFGIDKVESFICASATVAQSTTIGHATWIHPNVTISSDCTIGNGVIVGRNASIGHHCKLGDFVKINPGVHIASNTIIESHSELGIGASVINGIRIGKRSFVAAGAAVIRDIPADVLVAGVPANIKSK